jgi:hypothetical protein
MYRGALQEARIAHKLRSRFLYGNAGGVLLRTYDTLFPLTQNPLSEGGQFVNGGTDGVSWADMRSDGVHGYGTQVTHADPPTYDDSHAHLIGYRPNHWCEGTLYINGSTTGLEANLFIRQQITANNSRGWEINLYLGGPALHIVRWEGALASFTDLTPSGITTNCVFTNGAVWYAEVIGSTLTVMCNGVIVHQRDLTQDAGNYWATGNPGLGHYATQHFGPNAALANVGWSRWRAGEF